MSSEVGQQHPLSLYFWIWGLLFVVSAGSYMIDFFQVGYDVGTMELRWALILVFMFLKAGYIVAIFMHLKWERLALIYALLLPPGVLMVVYFGAEVAPEPAPVEHVIH